MPASLHKLLVHGADVIRSLMLPIGAYSEEAQESRNKHVKWYREKRARKTSRKDNITDQFRQLCVTSDPAITAIIKREVEAKQRKRSRSEPESHDDLRELLVTDEKLAGSDDEQPSGYDGDSAGSDSESDSGSDLESDNRTARQVSSAGSLSRISQDSDDSCRLPDYYYDSDRN